MVYLVPMVDVRAEADRILEATADLGELRKRLAELDAERAAVEAKIQQRLAQVGALGPVESKAPVSAADHVMAYMRLHPDTIITAVDIARDWKVTSVAHINNIRTALSRLYARGKLEKISVGRYLLRSR